MQSILFLGDIASPDKKSSVAFLKSLEDSGEIFANKTVIANLEGLINTEDISAKTPVLYNDVSIIEPLNLINTKVVSLANNHSLDLPENYEETRRILKNNSIGYCGAGTTENEAQSPSSITIDGINILTFGFCWDVLMQHQKNLPGKLVVSAIEPKRIIQQIEKTRKEHPKAIIILKMHWNFDLETLPFPMHRQFSRALIDAGANAVIGSHSHCVQGGERYKNGIIFYGLGNFFIPWYTFINGTIHFPEISQQTVALEWNPETGNAIVHWFWYDFNNGKHTLTLQETENFDESEKLIKYSPYQNLTEKEYLKFFKKFRRKKFLLPVYRNYNDTIRNKLIDIYLIYRIKFARLLSKLKLRNWNN